jgi:hypothetical protein
VGQATINVLLSNVEAFVFQGGNKINLIKNIKAERRRRKPEAGGWLLYARIKLKNDTLPFSIHKFFSYFSKFLSLVAVSPRSQINLSSCNFFILTGFRHAISFPCEGTGQRIQDQGKTFKQKVWQMHLQFLGFGVRN